MTLLVAGLLVRRTLVLTHHTRASNNAGHKLTALVNDRKGLEEGDVVSGK